MLLPELEDISITFWRLHAVERSGDACGVGSSSLAIEGLDLVGVLELEVSQPGRIVKCVGHITGRTDEGADDAGKGMFDGSFGETGWVGSTRHQHLPDSALQGAPSK